MNSILRSLAGGLILFLLMLSSAWAEETYELDIADQELSSALKQFAEQSGLQVVYFADLAAGKQAKGVRGTYSADQALSELLDDTDLTYSTVDERTYSISGAAAAEDAGGDSDLGNGRTTAPTHKPVMMAQASVEQNQASRSTETDSDEDEIKRPLEEIVVTGTLGEEFAVYLEQRRRWLILLIEFWAEAARDPRLQPKFAHRHEGLRAAVSEVVAQRATRFGDALPLPPGDLATLLIALTNGMAVERLADPAGVPENLYARGLDILLP